MEVALTRFLDNAGMTSAGNGGNAEFMEDGMSENKVEHEIGCGWLIAIAMICFTVIAIWGQ
jgi:hypothetical protein